jgi:hypothetical protein
MNTYKANVRVAQSGGIGTFCVWVHMSAQNTIAAKSLLEAQYGRGKVVHVPTLLR